MTLLGELRVAPDELFGPANDGRWNQRLAAYWSARDRFIAVGRDIRPSRDVHAMLAQLAAPLLEVLRISADFRPASDPLLRMAEALAQMPRLLEPTLSGPEASRPRGKELLIV